ncbi:uncharacterized protein LOC129953165 [Eupeodes corollae]|uniref:uncharacterized protein LOC129953165 n=1 Tax=Eupeodes corollae TaxID=290404 RepID=UPI0024925848|nr:uncharacterized protein LOC129953165 [Eupeodes corollae]XP_055921985.1 uncharacterized protein LOC129953165 [Eupeodes corollae]XP_055921986.1 uncharacterized protein LOC129953165 [Eupeodes corollae]
MQVATLFGGNVTSLASTITSTMDISSSSPATAPTKSVLASIEAKDEDNITKMSTKDTPSLTPNGEHLLSSISSPSIPSLYNVSSLANLASSALVENEQNLKSQQFEESKKGMDDSKKAEPEEASVGLETAATTETAKQTGKTIEADTIEATKTIVATETTVETAASSLIKTKEMEGEGENKQDKVIPMEEDISSTNENDFAILPNIVCDNPAETNIMVNLDNKKSLSPYDCPSITVSASASVNVPESLSPTSFDFNDPKNQNKVMSPSSGSSSSSPSCSLTSLSPSPACLEIHNFNACATSNKESSASHATTLLFDEAFMQHEQTQQQQQALPESSQLQNKENPSSTNPSNNIRETNGCVTSNLSDMNNLEAENLVIHHNNDDHSNNSNNNMTTDKETPFNSPQNQIERLMQQQPEDERRQMDGIEEGPLSHNQQIEFEHQQIQQHQHQQQQQHQQQHQIQSQQHHQQQQQQVNQQQTEQEEEQQRESAANDNDKLNPYSHANQYHECHRNDLNVDDISQRNIRDQHISQQNSMETSNVVDDYKLQHVPENLEMLNQMDHQQHQYQHQHHLSQNQHNMMQNQHAQQLYLHHQDQQHMMHHHQQQHHLQQQQQQQHHLQQQQQQHQHHHHSELMAYLHHQDQQNMQQPHLIRTYQTYQQQQHRMHQLHQHPQPQSPHHQPKNTSMTCIDDLMIDELHEDPNNRYKLLSPTVKHESQDDGYETSAGDVLTPNSHTSSQHSMTPQHQMHSSNLIPPKCEDLQSTAAHNHSEPDPYNFIDDEMNSNMRMMSPSSSNGLSMVLRQQNYESPPESNRLHMEDNSQVPMNMVNPQQQQQMIDSRMQVAQSHVDSADIDMASANNGCLNNMAVPKKRGRKKKGPEEITPSVRTMVDGILKPIMPKERKKHDRFNGMPEEEVSKRTLPDHLADNLDIIIIGINPGLFAAYKGHHYAGPGNHFWKCLYLSGLTHEQMTAEEDYKLLKFGIGFTNMVERATKGSADLTRKEIKEGSRILLDKLKRFRPKIAVFNGKLIFEVFSGKKDFNFGRQQECVEGTDTYMWVMPSSSARCAQLPRAADKVPFYAALKKFRDYLNGLIPHIDDIECVFNDQKSKQCCESESMRGTGNPPSPNIGGGGSTFLSPDCLNNENLNLSYNNSNSSTPERMSIPDGSSNLNKNNVMNIMHKGSPMDSLIGSGDNGIGGCGMAVTSNMNGPTNATNLCNSVMHMSCIMDQSGQQQQQPEKKKRGRPKKIKGIDGEEGPLPQKVRNSNSMTNNNTNNNNNNNILNLTLMGDNGEMPKKKRGRPKKIKSDIGVNLSHVGANLATTNNNNCNSNSGNISAINNNNNSMDNSNSSIHNALVNKTDICAHRNSPSGLGNHQMLSINNSNHFNSQSMPQHQQQQQQQQHQSLQNQRLFTSPMHSPNTVSSYCPMGINASTTPPIGNNTNSPNNPSNLVNNGPGQGYHQHQQHANSHHLQAQQQHNHNVQQHVQHQLHIPSLIYMHSPNHNPQQSSKSPHYGSSHSDLSTEISAAISSDHLAESQSASSPAMVGAVDYDRPDSIPNEEHSAHDLRFTSPTPNSGDQQQQGGGGSISAHQHYHNLYQNSGSNQSYLSGNTISNSPGEAAANKSNDNENVNYIASSRPNTSNSNNSTPQPAQNAQQTQQKRNMQISDVTSKSLSGLESLVDQIPTIADNDSANNSINSSVVGIKTDSNEDFPSPSSGGSGAGSSNSGGLGCVYMPSYSNLNSSTSSSPSAVLIATPQPSNSSILHSPHHYPDPIYSTANTCPSSTNSNNNSINNYNSIASNFSVSSLTSNNYSSNSYHSNLMAAAAASSPHHITSSASGSPMYMDPHMAVSPIYHHPYSQHAGYGAYSPVGHPPPPPHTLHMPSPNYPYAYPNTPGYPSQAGHHPSHSSPAGYLTNHPSMFDRIKPDIGYGGY